MLKKYKSNSLVSLNVVLPTGGNTHISFNAITGGGSVYYTDNVSIQKGLEQHPKFGKLFVVDSVFQNTQTQNAGKVQASVAKTGTEPTAKADKKVLEVEISCNDDAKEYLADNFGVSRSKLRSRAQIDEVAAENKVKFVWK